MYGTEYVLAMILLTAPPDSPMPAGAPERYAELWPVLQKVAIDRQILDPREVRYILTRPQDFCTDLNMLRRRQRELADAPGLHDSLRFPHRDLVNDFLAFNRAYRQHLTGRQALDLVHWWEHQEAIQETDQLFRVWDTLRDARCDHYYVTVRRQALKQLRCLIGPCNYYSGRLPPCVPIWRFQAID